MKVKYLPTFIKDLKKLKKQPVYEDICELVFEKFPQYPDLAAIPKLKKLKGEKDAYRIRFVDYRLGFFFESGQVIFARVLHRKDIYKRFP